MSENRGKQFENVIRESFLKVPNTSVIRMPDPMMGYAGVKNFCDFIVYHYPYMYCIECKSVHGNTLPFSNITKNQWDGLLEQSKNNGVIAGIMCWWVDRDVTLFLPIQDLEVLRYIGDKRVDFEIVSSIDNENGDIIEIKGKKKRVFFDYNMEEFFDVFDS